MANVYFPKRKEGDDDEKDEEMDGITGVFVSCTSINGFIILG